MKNLVLARRAVRVRLSGTFLLRYQVLARWHLGHFSRLYPLLPGSSSRINLAILYYSYADIDPDPDPRIQSRSDALSCEKARGKAERKENFRRYGFTQFYGSKKLILVKILSDPKPIDTSLGLRHFAKVLSSTSCARYSEHKAHSVGSLPRKNTTLRYLGPVGGRAHSTGNSCSIKTIWYSSSSVSQRGSADSFALAEGTREAPPFRVINSP